jgi:hypothetical protein
MNARVKRVTAAQDAVDGEDGLIVVRKLKKRPMFDGDGKFTGWIRWVVVDRANKDLQSQPEAAAASDAIDKGIMSGHDQTC